MSNECGEGLGGFALFNLDGTVFDDGVGDGVEAGGLEVNGNVVDVGACTFGLSALGDEALSGLTETGAKRLAFRERGWERTTHEGDAVEVYRLPRGVVDAKGEALFTIGGVDEGGAPIFEM